MKDRKLKSKHLLGLEELSKEEIELILDQAESFKEISERTIKKVPALRGKTVVNLFFEPSTRTRTSFELAAKRLSADTINVASSSSSVLKGETLNDTARNIEAMKVDYIIMRHSRAGAPHMLAKIVSPSVINAGDGSHEHPTQALLDAFTIRQKAGKIEGLNVSIIGDIAHSRVARSNIWALTKLGANVTVCGPKTLIPAMIEKMGVKVTYDLKEAVKDADALNILRIQLERQKRGLFPSIREYASEFGVNK
ncbi:MAG: aspartate carbamoyltransferase catalytic subunit, partial [Candidatus Omnitrophota bacterium]